MTTIPFLNSPNHASRNGVKITDIVLHWMAGNLAGCDATFKNAARQTSAHYGIEGTTVHQYVQDSDVAWHSGDWNENQRSIGIEHSAAPGRDASPATIATSVALIVSLCRKYGISPDHIYPHKKFFNTACPGTLPIADIIARVRAQLGKPAPTPQPVPAPVKSTRNIALTIAIQKACHVAADGKWGNGTQTAATAVIRRDTSNIRALQGWVGTTVDGIWGKASEAARVATIKRLQMAMGVTQDGSWGPISARAWATAVAANLNKF